MLTITTSCWQSPHHADNHHIMLTIITSCWQSSHHADNHIMLTITSWWQPYHDDSDHIMLKLTSWWQSSYHADDHHVMLMIITSCRIFCLSNIINNADQCIYFLCLLKGADNPPPPPPNDSVSMYISLIQSVLEYACELWHPGLTKEQCNIVEHLQMTALTVTYPDISHEHALNRHHLPLCKRGQPTYAKTSLCKSSNQILS